MEGVEIGPQYKDYEQIKTELQELLGDMYSERIYDGVVASSGGPGAGIDEGLEKLRSELEAAGTDDEKDEVRTAWLQEYAWMVKE